jgi:hypothetical protein
VIRSPDLLTAARAEALFTSLLSSASLPRPAEVADAIRGAVRAHGGTRGCAVEVAGEFGDHPDTAALRMRWALQVVESTYVFARGRLGTTPVAHLDFRADKGVDPGVRAAS